MAALASARWRTVVLLVLGVTAAKLLYLAFVCPYSLVEDEAHYWEWSRRLEWSYYSKGPGVAWAIAASDWFFARLGIPTSEFTVRVPSVLASAVLTLAIAALARRATGNPRAGLYAALAATLSPVLWFGGLLMTIDVPYAACWALAALCAWAALRERSGPAWLGLGAALGAGFLFKYTILLLVPGLLAFALVSRRAGTLRLAPAWTAWFLPALAIFALALAPVTIWNAQHDWATLRHLLGHLGLAGGDVAPTQGTHGWRYKPGWTFTLIGSQLPLLGPIMILAVWSVFRTLRSSDRRSDLWTGQLYLILCALPIFLFYLVVSFIAEPEGNWPLAGWVTLIALAGWGAVTAVDEWRTQLAAWTADPARPWRGFIRRRPETFPRMMWQLTLVVGVSVALISLRADWLADNPVTRAIEARARSAGLLAPGRRIVPLGRLMGGPAMGADADRLARELTVSTGKPAFVIAKQYGRASLLAFYMPGRPTVYCSSGKGDGRRTQYDLWPQTSLDDPSLLGRPAVLVGGYKEEWTPAFHAVTEHGLLQGESKKDRITYLATQYQGFPAPPSR